MLWVVTRAPNRADDDERGDSIEKAAGTYHHGNLREALIAAAREVIANGGPQSLSLRAVARRAGVSTAAPYRHFSSRNGLLAAVAQEGFETLSGEIRAATGAHPDDPVARLREAGVAYVCFANRNPAHYQVMFTAGLVDATEEPAYRAAAAGAFGLLLEAIEECQTAKLIRDEDPKRLALVAWSGVHGLASLIGTGEVALLGFGCDNVEELARYVADTLVSGVLL